MSKFNRSAGVKTTNKSGFAAYRMGDRERLATQVLTTFFGEPKYYGDNSDEIVKLLRDVAAKDPVFVAKLGVFARYDFNMRTISHVVGAVLANVEQGKPFARAYACRVCRRADDMTELLACYMTLFGKPIPNSLKKGLADALKHFDEYALAKYDRNGLIKLRDLIQIVHPAPQTGEQEELWKRVLERTLATPLTWETELSKSGNNAGTWEKLISENALGYMAMLRNLRNIIEAGPRNIGAVYEAIADPERVRKSRVLPFRFYSAYRELRCHPRSTSRTFHALEAALDAATANIEGIPGKTLIAIDVSGSMDSAVSRRSTTTCRDIACLIGAMAGRICEDSLVVTFDTDIRKHTFSRRAGILEAANAMHANGGGTNIHLPFAFLLENKIAVDRVILLSDNEVNRGWSGRSWYGGRSREPVQKTADLCRRKLNPQMWVHAIDLQGLGTQQFVGDRTNIIAGWSERVLEFIHLAETGTDTLIERMEAVQL